MDTPIYDFLQRYRSAEGLRFHMPGHKGKPFLGFETLDITEIGGADSLYEAGGIIAQSEKNASALFGSRRSFYSTEGSSQCIRAMLHLALQCRKEGTPPLILAARNVHKAFVYAAALLDFETVWLWPEESSALCSCPISASALEKALESLPQPPAAVYITSPDYLGKTADIAGMAKVCHNHGTILAVDNAHGAYLHFLTPPAHPLDLGADICCDSAHKTLPVLTGGAYLHISAAAPAALEERARAALALFGSTSPSYLTLASLDLCNDYLDANYAAHLAETVSQVDAAKAALSANGWTAEESDALRICLRAPEGTSGISIAENLRQKGMECEFADPEHIVFMLGPENGGEEISALCSALGVCPGKPSPVLALPSPRSEQVMSIRRGLFSPCETVSAEMSLGRVCGAPTVSCPPAVPIAVSGERIGPEALALFKHYGVDSVSVVKE